MIYSVTVPCEFGEFMYCHQLIFPKFIVIEGYKYEVYIKTKNSFFVLFIKGHQTFYFFNKIKTEITTLTFEIKKCSLFGRFQCKKIPEVKSIYVMTDEGMNKVLER